MGNFFGLDSPFTRFGNILSDILILSFLWIFCSLPLFTIGASTTALYYTTTKIVTDRDGYIFKDFFKSFKRDFLKATGAWLLILLITFIIYSTLVNMDFISETIPILNGFIRTVYISMLVLFFIELCMFTVFVFPILSRFELSFKSLLATSLFMANRHLLTTVLCFALFAAIFFIGVFVLPFILLVSMGIYAYLSSWLLVRAFKKYKPEIDDGNKII
ncbi:MAG: DUF624 domain-containing protein [Clostridiales bacterium]|jgi:uncharacterized membrane protein YesL|nr:DUF624 domain-containing protein [Clostridiales bacterium]